MGWLEEINLIACITLFLLENMIYVIINLKDNQIVKSPKIISYGEAACLSGFMLGF